MNSREFFYTFGKLLYNIDSYYTMYAKKYKVKENELWLLYALNDDNNHSQIEISKNWDIPKTTINTIVKEYEKLGYVELIQIKGEKRKMYIKLTKLGKDYAEKLLEDLYQFEKKLYSCFTFDVNAFIKNMEEVREKLFTKEVEE